MRARVTRTRTTTATMRIHLQRPQRTGRRMEDPSSLGAHETPSRTRPTSPRNPSSCGVEIHTMTWPSRSIWSRDRAIVGHPLISTHETKNHTRTLDTRFSTILLHVLFFFPWTPEYTTLPTLVCSVPTSSHRCCAVPLSPHGDLRGMFRHGCFDMGLRLWGVRRGCWRSRRRIVLGSSCWCKFGVGLGSAFTIYVASKKRKEL